LAETVTYLGISTIKNLAMALETFSSAAESSGLSEAALLAMQKHSLLTGQIARQIEAKEGKKTEEAFLAGVLHEVGWLVKVKDKPGQSPGVTVDRTLLGAYLLGLWGLPHPIMEAVAYHKEPRLLVHSAFELVDIVYVADHLASEMGAKGTVEQKLDLAYLASIGIDEAKLSEMCALAEKVARTTADDSSEERHG
jgi:HD-like signal output (HDOD) protein